MFPIPERKCLVKKVIFSNANLTLEISKDELWGSVTAKYCKTLLNTCGGVDYKIPQRLLQIA